MTGAYVSYIYLSLSKVFVGEGEPKGETTLEKNSTSHTANIVLLGYGGEGHGGGNLSDVIMVVNINSEKKRVTLISIPRDLWVEIPVRSDLKEKHKINSVFAIGLDDERYPLKEPRYKGEAGGGSMSKKVVGEITGIKIDYFIAVDFEGFKKIIDTLGGIEVDVPVPFDDYFYPVRGLENETCGKTPSEIAELHQKYSGFNLEKQFECRYEHIHFDKGKNQMDGETALKFVRSRHSSQHGGDFARSQRQQAVILGIKDKLLSLYALKRIGVIFDEFLDMVRTDLDFPTIQKLVEIFGRPEEYKISFVLLNEDNVLVSSKSPDGQFILIPKLGEDNWSGVQSLIFREINN